MSDRRQHWTRRYGVPRPVRPEWQLSQREVWAMLSRAHFTRWRVARIVRRQLVTATGSSVVVRKIVCR